MKKIAVILVVMVGLSGCVGEKQEKGMSSVVVMSEGKVVAAYRDGKDVTDERLALEEQTEKSIFHEML